MPIANTAAVLMSCNGVIDGITQTYVIGIYSHSYVLDENVQGIVMTKNRL